MNFSVVISKNQKELRRSKGMDFEKALKVAAKMVQAFRAGTYNKDSRAIKATCKRLNIKHTYKEINTYLGAA